MAYQIKRSGPDAWSVVKPDGTVLGTVRRETRTVPRYYKLRRVGSKQAQRYLAFYAGGEPLGRNGDREFPGFPTLKQAGAALVGPVNL
jgi:hypothetical protein